MGQKKNTKKTAIITKMTGCSDIGIVGPLPIKLPLKSKAMPLFYLDGGISHRPAFQSAKIETLGYCLGDNDSYQGSDNEFDLLLEKKKDMSDFAMALTLIKEAGLSPKSLHLYGLYGERLDHQLAIFGELRQLMVQSDLPEKAYFYPSYMSSFCALFINQTEEIKLTLEGTFSLMAFEATKVSASGELEYSMTNHSLLPLSSFALSNRARGLIKLKADKPILLLKA